MEFSVLDSIRPGKKYRPVVRRGERKERFGTSALTFVREDDLLAIRVSHWESTFNLSRLRSLHLLLPESEKASAGANDGIIQRASEEATERRDG